MGRKSTGRKLNSAINTIILIPLMFLVGVSSSIIGVILFFIFLYINIYIHELGHFIAGKLVRFKKFTVTIGTRKELLSKKFLDNLFILKSGSGGSTGAIVFGKSHIRLRLFIFTLGGVAFNGLIVFLILLINGVNAEPNGINMPIVIAASNIFYFITNLIPKYYYPNGIKSPNDGLRLLKIPFMKEDEISELLLVEKINKADELLKNKKYIPALKEYEYLFKEYPKSEVIIINYSICLMKCLKFDLAKDILFDLKSQKHKNIFDPLILNNIAWLYLLEMNKDSIISADKFSAEAIKLNSNLLNIQNTRGGILILTGRIYEGISLLKQQIDIRKPIDEKKNNPTNYMFLVYGYLLKGEKDEVERYIKPLNNYLDKLEPDDSFLYEKLKQKTNNFTSTNELERNEF